MSAFENKRLIIDRFRELPEVNGTRINAIYGRMNTAYIPYAPLVDAGANKPDYYLLCTEDTYYDKDGNYRDKKNIKVKTLPKELAALFGTQKVKGKETYITRLWFRTSDSGNGSFTDQSIQLNGAGSITYYRTKRWAEAPKDAVFVGEPFEKKIVKVLGKKFKATELPEGYDVEYPCTYIRNEGGLNYPDVKQDSWRWLYGHPYISNKPNSTKNIRVYFEHLKAHLYLEAVEPKEGDENLIQVTFPSGRDKHPEQFCHLGEWAESKKEAPKELIRFKILKVDKKNNWSYTVGAMIGDKIQWKRQTHNLFYRLNSISYI